MSDKISCREGVYQGGWKVAIEYLPQAGVKYVELGDYEKAELVSVAGACREKGVTPLTIAGGVDCDKPESVNRVKAECEAAKAVGVQYYFLSAHGKDRAAAMKTLAGLGAFAAKCGVTLCLETHPPFCLNADEMRKTINEVNHPNVRINFDTANVMYYNEGLHSAEELEKIIDVVASMHMKDTDGGFHSLNFPVLGKGVVDFSRVIRILHDANFAGPLTLELEGPIIDKLDLAGRHEAVKACVEHLGKYAKL